MSSEHVSRFERYVTVLQTLDENGSSSIIDLEEETGLSHAVLLLALRFLKQQAYVKLTDKEGNDLYDITSKGTNVCRYFRKKPQITSNCFQ